MTDIETKIVEELAGRGYELTDVERATTEMPVEELIISILKDLKGGRTVEGIPVIIKKNKVNYNRLTELALQKNVVNELGYVLEITRDLFEEFNINGVNELESTIEKLEGCMDEEEHYLSPIDSPHYPEIARNHQTLLLKKWNVLGLYQYERFKHAFHVYALPPSKGIYIHRIMPADHVK